MKKKNLLSLTALCLTLGLVVTSCSSSCGECVGEQGPAGPKGDKGDPGTPGADGADGQDGEDGEDGSKIHNGTGAPASDLGVVGDYYLDTGSYDFYEKTEEGWEKIGNLKGEAGQPGTPGAAGEAGQAGQPGKTYIAIINATDLDIDHPYFVEQGEKVTLEFNLDASQDEDMVSNLTLNGGDVEVPVGQYSIEIDTSLDAYKGGIQITSGVYTSFLDHAKSLVIDHYKGLAAADSQLVAWADPVATTSTTTATQVESDYFDRTVMDKVHKEIDASGSLNKAYDDLADTLTPAERVVAMQEAASKVNTAVDTLYASVITKAKGKADGAIETAANAVPTANYAAEDKAADIKRAKDAVAACETLAEIATLVNGVANHKGSYNKFFENKSAAFELVADALATATTNEDLSKLKDELARWNVTVGSTPAEIAADYNKQISAATSFELNDAGQPVIGVEGAQEIAGALTDVKDQLLTNIRASYLKEIADSTVLTTDEQKTVGTSLILNAISEWQTAHTSPKVADYVSTTNAADLSKDVAQLSLVEYLEKSIYGYYGSGSTANNAFLNERIENHAKGMIESLKAKAEEIKASDALYASAIAYTHDEANNRYVVTNPVLVTVKDGEKTVTVENPLFGSMSKTTDATPVSYVYDLTEIKKHSVDEIYNDTVEAAKKATSVLNLSTIFDGKADGMEDAYDLARDTFATAAKTALTSGNYIGTGTPIAESEWDNYYAADKVFTMDDAAASVATLVASSSKVQGVLDTISDFWTDLAASDPDYAKKFDVDGTDSTLRDSTAYANAEVVREAVIKGTATDADISGLEASMKAGYDHDVEVYVEDVAELAAQVYQNTISGNITVDEFVKIREAYQAAEVELKSVTTVTGANAWLQALRNSFALSQVDITAGEAPDTQTSIDVDFELPAFGATYENSADFATTLTSVDGTTYTYKVTGTASTMDATQATAWGTTAGAKYVILACTIGVNGSQYYEFGSSTTADGTLVDVKSGTTTGPDCFACIFKVSEAEGARKFFVVNLYDNSTNKNVVAKYVFDLTDFKVGA